MADGLPLTPEQERAALLERASLIQKAQEIQDSQSEVDPEVVDSPITAGINTFIDDALLGQGPEAIAASDAIPAAAKGEKYSDAYKRLTKENRAILNAQQEASPNAKRLGSAAAFALHTLSPTIGAATKGLDKIKFLKNNPVLKQALVAGGFAGASNPGETSNMYDEVVKRGQNALMGSGAGLGLGLGAKYVAIPAGKAIYKRGVAPIAHAVDMKLNKDFYPWLESTGMTGSLKSIGNQIQGKYDEAGKVVGEVLGTATQKGGVVNHRGLAARLKSVIPSAGADPLEDDINNGLRKTITDKVENYQSDAYRAAIPKYRTEKRAFIDAKRAQQEFDKNNPNIFTKFKDLIGMQNPARPQTPINPVKPTNEMGLEAANNIRVSLGMRGKQNFSPNQSNTVPVKAEVFGDMYPIMRDVVDNEVLKASGKEALSKLQPANKIFSLLKPNMDTIEKSIVAANAPGNNGWEKIGKLLNMSTIGLVDNAPVLTRLGQATKRAGELGTSKSGRRLYQKIPSYLLPNGYEEEE